jgi:DNA-binding ferritin-like protein
VNRKYKNNKTLKKKKIFRKEKSSKSVKKSCKYKTKYIKDEFKDLKKQIIIEFFEMMLCIKLFHWKMYNYGAYKATDEIYEKLNSHMDRFIEVIIGKNERRINMENVKSILLHDINDNEKMRTQIEKFVKYLMSLDKKKLGSDLYNIRDDIVTDLNQFLYLLSFH